VPTTLRAIGRAAAPALSRRRVENRDYLSALYTPPMNWGQVLIAFVAAAAVASFTDWYFFGVLFHDRYFATPGVWRRYVDRKDEMRSIAISELYMSVSLFVFIVTCAHQHWTSVANAATAAVVAWVMLPVPLLVTNAIYIPMSRLLVVSHALGWLARLLVAAICIAVAIR
jgi:hypothetical protein